MIIKFQIVMKTATFLTQFKHLCTNWNKPTLISGTGNCNSLVLWNRRKTTCVRSMYIYFISVNYWSSLLPVILNILKYGNMGTCTSPNNTIWLSLDFWYLKPDFLTVCHTALIFSLEFILLFRIGSNPFGDGHCLSVTWNS